MVLLTGGTDGGNHEPIAARRARRWWTAAGAARSCGRQRRRARRGRRDPRRASRTCWPTTWSRGSACWRPARRRAAIREVFLSHVIGGKHLSASATRLHRDGARRDPRRRADRRRAAGHRGRRGRGRRRRRRHHRRALGRRARPGAGRAGPRRRRAHPGDPHRRGRPRHALVGDLDRRGGRARPSSHEAAARRRADPGFLPGDRRRSTTRTRRSPGPRSASPCAGTPAGRKVVVSPEGRVVERTGVDLREVDLVVGSGGVLRHGRAGVAERVLGAERRTRTATGSCPSGPGSSSTPTTCWPRPGCWPPSTPTRRTGWSTGSLGGRRLD